MSAGNNQAWWHRIPDPVRDEQAAVRATAQGYDVVPAEDFTAAIYQVLGTPTPEDREQIEARLEQARVGLQELSAGLSAEHTALVVPQWTALAGELTKADRLETPDPSLIISAGDWLLENVPGTAELLAGVLSTPAIGRALADSPPAIRWIKNRFA